MENGQSFWKNILFELGNNKVVLGDLILATAALILVAVIYLFLSRYFLNRLIKSRLEGGKSEKKSIYSRWILTFVLIAIAVVIWTLGIDFHLAEFAGRKISVLTLLAIIILLAFSSLIDWLFSYVVKQDESDQPEVYERKSKQRFSPGANIQLIVYTVAIILAIRGFNLDFKILPDRPGGESIDLYFSNIFSAIVIILSARLIVWVLTNIILFRIYKIKKIEYSSQFAINQILAYIIFVVAAFVALENMGVKMTLIWGGAAALLVGVGLGLQQTFNDLISGIILLFERTVEVGAVLEIGGTVGKVRKIGIRTSIIETRENLTIIVPNSKLIVDNVVNWNHNDDKARFKVSTRVGYGTDTNLVRKLLLQAADAHPEVLKEPAPFIWFTDFGESALLLELHFWSKELLPVENVKSDLRFSIDEIFRAHGIAVPFPQRDIRIRKEDEDKH